MDTQDWDNIDVNKIIKTVEDKKHQEEIPEKEKPKITSTEILETIQRKEKAQEILEDLEEQTKLDKDDFRTNLRFAKCCQTCRHFWSQSSNSLGWCHYPRTRPSLSMSLRTASTAHIRKVLSDKGWKKTHSQTVCDLWALTSYQKLGSAMDWCGYQNLPVPKEKGKE